VRAARCEGYGGPEVVRVVEVDDPTPKRGEVVVRVGAAAVTVADARIRGARFPRGFGRLGRLAFGIRRPRRPILGGTVAGTVIAVGEGVDRFAAGDRVAGSTGMRFGGHAEQVAVAVDRLARIPASVDDVKAAGVLFGGMTARWVVTEKAPVKAGDRVLVVGGSGSLGTNLVQLASAAGAEVTAVTGPDNRALVEGLGAVHHVDHRSVDVFERPERYDLVIDTVGAVPRTRARSLLAPGGRAVLLVATLGELLLARGDVVAGTAPDRVEDVEALLDLVAAGSLEVVIDDVLRLDDIVAAHRRVDTGHKVGNLLIRP
jgi:NADPH:quinone reductase-like Zn-dependent oxidoreductase